MNKLAIAAAVLLALVLLALPRVVGSMTEARVRERVAAIDASDSASATLTSFERGWFRSNAKIELRFVPDNVPQLGGSAGNPFTGTGTVPIAVDFAHGPIAVLDGVHLGWSKMIARADTEVPGVTELEHTLGVPYLFEFRGRTSYAGAMGFDADAPPFELPVDETLFTFSGATLAGSFAGRQLEGNAQVGSIEFTSPTGTFALRNVHASADNELRSRYVMPGEASLTIERVLISDARGTTPVFEAANLRMLSDVALDSTGVLLEMRMNYDLDSMRIEESEVTAATIGMAMRNVDVAALEAYGAAARDAASAGADPATIMASLGPQLERALQAEPRLTLEPIRFRLDDEPFEGRIELSTNAARLPPAGTLDLGNPLLVLGLMNTDAEMRASKALAQKLATLAARLQLGSDGGVPPEQLDYMAEAQSGLLLTMLVGQGVLVDDGDGYRSSLRFTNGALTLNGNPLPFGLP
jgi:uncharacterized protein YdgA (DUF945 family)